MPEVRSLVPGETGDSLDLGFQSLGSANPFLAPTGATRSRSILLPAPGSDQIDKPSITYWRVHSGRASRSNFLSFEIQPAEPLFPMRVVIVKFPAGKTKQTVRLQHVASGKIFVRLLYCSLRVLGREPSVSGAPLSEYGLRRLICLQIGRAHV